MIEHANEQQLQTFLDGELAPAEQARLELHLRDCTLCQTRLEQQRELFRMIESLPETAVQKDLRPQILALLQPAARWLPPLALGQLLAALVIVTGLLFGLGRTTVEFNLNAAAQRLASGVEAAAADLMAAMSEAAAQLPNQIPTDSAFALPNPASAWAIAALALALWAAGNGFVLRRVRREGRG